MPNQRWLGVAVRRLCAPIDSHRRSLSTVRIASLLRSSPAAPLLRQHRCSAVCLCRLVSSSTASSSSPSSSRSFASSPNPLPVSSSGNHVVSSSLPADFHPADPEIAGYKTRLSVERRVYKAVTALPKFSSHPLLQQAAPPQHDDAVDEYPIGHDDPLARLSFHDLQVDSLDKVELLVSVEKEFGHEFSDADYDGFTTVGDLIEAVLWTPDAK